MSHHTVLYIYCIQYDLCSGAGPGVCLAEEGEGRMCEMLDGERKAYKGRLVGPSPQRTPGVEPLVSDWGPCPKVTIFCLCNSHPVGTENLKRICNFLSTASRTAELSAGTLGSLPHEILLLSFAFALF